MTDTPLPHPAWPAFSHPHRFVEARRVLTTDLPGILAARGPDFQETALHWAAIGDAGLALDMVGAGFDANALDRLGRTPLDWFSDLLWMSIVWDNSQMTAEGKDRLRFKASRQIPMLWGRGFRPGPGAGRPVGEVWIRSGVYSLCSLLDDAGSDGPGLRAWGVDQANALHAWALSDAPEGRPQALEDLLARGLSIDEPDAFGRTPLRYVVEAWAADSVHRRVAAHTVSLLLDAGADPSLPDSEGVAPGAVPLLREGLEQKKIDAMARALERDTE